MTGRFAKIAVSFSLLLIARCSAASAGEPLQGSIKNDAPLNSSVHVIPNTTPVLPSGASAAQYNGSHLQGGAGTSVVQGGVNQPVLQDGAGVQQFNGSHMVGGTAPTTTYTFTPHTSVMQIPGQIITTPGSSGHGVMNFAGTSGASQVQSTSGNGTGGSIYGTQYNTNHGVTTSSGYSVVSIPIGNGGSMPAEPDFVIYRQYGRSDDHGFSFAPGFEPKSGGDEGTNGRLAWATPGTSVTIFGARQGITTYVPGYEISVSTVGVEKETIGGVWSVPSMKPLLATAGRLASSDAHLQILAPDIHPLLAKAQLLPAFLKNDKVLTWKMWYDKVAAAIYRRWKYADVGPGTATVRVTVGADKQVSAQIIDFEPAVDAQRNAEDETAFRATALRAVNLVTSAEIPKFPENSTLAETKFDVDLRRTAADAGGYDVHSEPHAEETVVGELKK